VYLANTITTCTGNCAGRNEVPPSGTSQNNGPGYNITYVDIDGDASTFSSSSDSLNLANCSEVLFAGLYWGGVINAGTANYANRNRVKLKVNNGSYIDLTADDLYDNTAGYTSYHCYKDITSIVTANGNARYTLANMVAQTGTTNLCGGWSIVVVYKNNLLDMRNLTVFDGLAVVRTGVSATDIPISGFLTPLTGPVTFEVGAISYDGDRSQTGDQLLFNGAGSFVNISDALSTTNDVFNSTISNNGVLTPFRMPSYNNTLGYDADIFRPNNAAKNYIGNSDVDATVRFSTGGETILLHVVTTAIDVYEPDVRLGNSVTDVNGGLVQPGDTLQYTVTVKNIGSDISIQSVVTDSLMFNIDYVPNSTRIVYGPNTGLKTDATGDDQVDYDPVGGRIIVRVGTGANGTTGGSINNDFIGTDSTVFTFRVTATKDCGELLCNSTVSNRARISYVGQISGNNLTAASNPNIYDPFGCPIEGSTVTQIQAGLCALPADTSVHSLCGAPFATLYPRPGYTFYNSSFAPVTQLTASGTYYAIRNIGNGACMDTVQITATFTPCEDTDGDGVFNPYDNDDDNDGVPDYTELCGPAATDFTCLGGNPDEDTDEDGTPNYQDPDFCTLNISGVCQSTDLDNDGTIGSQDLDSDNDGISDVTESGGSDSDNDGIIGSGPITDTDGDGWSNITDPTNGGTPLANLDSDGDGHMNNVDLDSDNDGITDVVENGMDAQDANNDGMVDGTDTDGDGAINIPGVDGSSSFGGTFTPAADTDNDGIINTKDIDSDDDGITDVRENGGTDVNNDGHADGTDADNDGVVSTADSQPGFGAAGNPLVNSDADGRPNYLDIDSDNDGIPDNIEAQSTAGYIAPAGSDADNDGLDNAYDATSGHGGNGVTPVNTDGADNPDYLDLNSDNDGITDAIEGFDSDASHTINGGEDATTGTDTDNDGLDNGYDNNNSSADPTNGQTPSSFPQHYGGPDRDWRQATNIPPVTVSNTNTTPEEQPLVVNAGSGILSNGDDDIDNTPLTVNTTPVYGPSNGNITIGTDGSYTYTPDPGFFGTDTVIVSVCDNGTPLPAVCTNDTLFITVTPLNDAPVVANETYSVNEDTPITTTIGTGILSNDTDGGGEGTTLTVNTTPVSGPDNGTISINTNGTFTYTPDADFSGTDTVIVSVCDNGIPLPAICVNDTIIITVNPVNDAPVTDNETYSTNEDVTLTVVPGTGILINDTDGGGEGTTLTVNTTPVSGPDNGTITVNTNGSFNYTPNANFNGTDTVIVSVCDNGTPLPAICVNDTIVITVNPVNDPPVVTNETYSTNEEVPLTVAPGTGILTNDTDGGGEGTTLTVTTTPVSGPDNGTITVNTDGSFTYTPDAGFSGNDTVIVSVCDNGIPLPAACINDTIVIVVGAVNDAPVVSNENYNATEDNPLVTTAGTGILSNDTDGGGEGTLLTVNTTPVSGPSNGTISISTDGSFTYTPNANFNGTDTVIVTVCDSGTPLPAICVNDTLFITIAPVNDAPVTDNETYTTNEDVALTVIPGSGILINDTDGGGEGTTLTVTTTPLYGPSNGTISVNANGGFTYTPDASFNGTDTVIVSLCDNGIPTPSICVNDTIIITVTPVNDAPVVANETYSVNEDTPVTTTAGTGILANDTDGGGEGTTLAVNTTPVSGPANGTITINTDGSFTYTPDADFNGTDTVVVTVCDNGLPLPAICVNDTLVITVNPINDAPVVANESYTTGEDAPLTVVLANGILANDTDGGGEGTTLTVATTPVSGPSNGTVSVNTDGSFTYTPDADFNGIDTVVVSVCDNGIPAPASCVNDTVFITVNPVNDPPVTVNETYVLDEDDVLTTNTGNGILSNGDTDGGNEGTSLNVTVTLVDSTDNGTVVVNTDGTFTYTPDPDYYGSDSFIVTVCDNGTPLPVQCTNDTITLVVNPVNDAPVASNDSSSVAVNGSTINIPVIQNDTDTENDTLTITIIGGPQNGNASVVNDTTVSYVPDNGFCGTDTIWYQVCDNGTPSLCDTAMIVIEVYPTDTDGDGLSDAYETTSADTDGDTVLDYLDLDSDNDGLTDAEEAEGTLACGTPDVNDTDGDGVPDHHDLDSDNDGLTDIVESGMGSADQDNDGVADVTIGWDANGDGLADSIENFGPQDFDGDGVEDQEDLDADNDGISDVVEGGNGGSDTNDDGVIDTNDTNGGDTDGDGITDSVDGSGTFGDADGSQNETDQDKDGDGHMDSEDLDADNDGIADVIEGGFGDLDTNNDGVVDGNDTDGDGIINLPEIDNNNTFNGTPDSQDETEQDADDDGVIDSEDTDSDNDGINDIEEGGHGDLDGDGDGMVDDDTDTDGDGLPDVVDGENGYGGADGSQDEDTMDPDGDGLINSEDTDSNGNDIPDPEEADTDCDGDSIPDFIDMDIDCDNTVTIPQGISPNGDGINDVLNIPGLDDYPDNKISIFNRWGNLVYQKDNYDNSWDGTATEGLTVGGDLLPIGTYFYVLDLGNNTEPLSGYIYLNR